MTVYYDVIVGLLLVFLVWRECANAKERRDLYNRLMARDLGDLRVMEGAKPPGSRNSVRAGLKRCSGEQEPKE